MTTKGGTVILISLVVVASVDDRVEVWVPESRIYQGAHRVNRMEMRWAPGSFVFEKKEVEGIPSGGGICGI